MLLSQKCTYRNMAESELLCERVATLLRSKGASTQELCHKVVFVVRIVKKIVLLLTVAPAENIANALVIAFVRTS